MEHKSIEPICGVYFLWRRGVIIYVGQSVNIHQRIAQHKTAKEMAFDKVTYLECLEPHLDALEKDMIEKHNPKFNSHHSQRMGVVKLDKAEPFIPIQNFDLFRLSKSKSEVDVCSNTLRAYHDEGLPFYKRGKAVFVSKTELTAFIKQKKNYETL